MLRGETVLESVWRTQDSIVLLGQRLLKCHEQPKRTSVLMQLELFCISKLINCLLDADEEFVFMDIHFAIGASSYAFVHAYFCSKSRLRANFLAQDELWV